MKTKSIIFALLACLTVGFTSCEDMLEAQSERHSYETATDTLYSYWGILKTLQNLGERYVLLGELRGDLVSPTEYVSDTIAAIADFNNPQDGDCRYLRASDFYAVINNCNAYLAAADTVRPIYGANSGMKYMLREYAQVWGIRAWTYMQLVQLYGSVPFYTRPLTSLDDVESFYNNGNCPMVDRYNLALEIEKEAGDRLVNLLDQDLPSYADYGMVHSKYCCFPLRAVMGDLWLLAARSQGEYAKAAQYYYDYLKKTRSVLPTGYNCNVSTSISYLTGEEDVRYSPGGQLSIFTEATSAPSSSDEVITVIPSTTNRQWGVVQTGVNDVFGFTTELTVSSSGKGDKSDTIVTVASVNLSLNPEPQCTGSKAFTELAKAYPTITIKGVEEDNASNKYIRYETKKQLLDGEEVPAPDARRAWLVNEDFIYNGNRQQKDYIEKQNPRGIYTTGFPVIYRKAAIWLRFAEAINRAGFPEYAYAVLAEGLCPGYMPRMVASSASTNSDYRVDYCYLVDTLNHKQYGPLSEMDAYTAIQEADPELYPNPVRTDHKILYLDRLDEDTIKSLLNRGAVPYVRHSGARVAAIIKSETVSGNLSTGLYVPLNQAVRAATVPYLQFEDANFEFNTVVATGSSTFDLGVSHGVHARGSNSNQLLAFAINGDSICPFYNFELCVKSKWPEFKAVNYYTNPGAYAAYQERLIDAVEELIVDEMALELCFEGNRFNDLVRVAKRRSPEWLARKVAARTTGNHMDEPELFGKLLNENNWYLKLPNF